MASKRSLRALSGLQADALLARNAARQPFVRHSSSTSAIAYKALHRRIQPLPAASHATSVSPAAAVSSILYETPLPSQSPRNRHVLNCLVQNEPGVLSRVSGILAARGFNIDSLVVCSTEVADLSRMTIVLQGQDGVVEQARRQLEDLVPVWAVLDYTSAPLVQRELLLAKISILGPEYFEELLAHHREMTDADAYHNSISTEDMTPEQLEAHHAHQQVDYHPRNLAPSEALRLKNQHLEHITHLTHQFGGKVLDISTNNCIVEVSAKPSRIDSFMKLIAPFGILESARTGESYRYLEYSFYTTTHILTRALQVSWPFPVRLFTVLVRSRRRTLRMSSTRAPFLLVKRTGENGSSKLSRAARFSASICSVPAFSASQGGEDMFCVASQPKEWHPCTTNPRFLAHLDMPYIISLVISSFVVFYI